MKSSSVLFQVSRWMTNSRVFVFLTIGTPWSEAPAYIKNLRFINGAKKLEQAIALFDKYKFLGKQATHLLFEFSKYPDLNTLLSLPRLLPNLKLLDWKFEEPEQLQRRRNQPVEEQRQAPPDQVCVEAFKRWKKLQGLYITIKPQGLAFEHHPLSGADLGNLVQLEIIIDKATPDARTANYPLAKELIQGIINALQLKYISLEGFTLSLKVMESIHSNAPNL